MIAAKAAKAAYRRPAYATKSGRLTKVERADIVRLSERGLSASQIAFRLERHPATVNFAMTAMGLRAPKRRAFSYVRNGSAVRSFSVDEDALITALRCQKFSHAAIARVLTARFGHLRTASTIGIRCKQIASLEELS